MQGTRKIGCCAHIWIVQFTLFLDYQIKTAEKETLSKWKLRQLREVKLANLQKELENGTPNLKTLYFVSLPTNGTHNNHPTGADIAFAQKVHPLLIHKISGLASSNIRDVYEVKKMIKHYTNNELAKELGFKRSENDRTFYPDITDVKNHVYKAKRALELSKIDQENLRLKVNAWAATDTENNFFLRPYMEASDASERRHLMYRWTQKLVHHKDFMVIQVMMTIGVKS